MDVTELLNDTCDIEDIYELYDETDIDYQLYLDLDNNHEKDKISTNMILNIYNILTNSKLKQLKASDVDNTKLDAKFYHKGIINISKKSIYFSNENRNHVLFFQAKKYHEPDFKYYNTITQYLLRMYSVKLYISDDKKNICMGIDKEIHNR